MHARDAHTPASSRNCFTLCAGTKCGLGHRQQFNKDTALHSY